MRQSSNHKVPTIPQNSTQNQPFSTEERLSTDYWNDSFLNEHSNHLNNRVAGEPQFGGHAFEEDSLDKDRFQGDRFEFVNFKENNFESDDLETDGFESDGFESDGFETNGFEETVNELDFHPGNRSASYSHDVTDDDLESFADDLTESLFSEFEEGRKTPGRPRGISTAKEHNIQRRVKHQLGQRLAKIVSAGSSADYFSQLIKILNEAVSALALARSPSKLQGQFQLLRSLIKRYATHGLEELDVLEDVIEIYLPENNERWESLGDLSSLLVGLATRIVLKPRLQAEEINPAIVQKLSGAIAQSLNRLATNRQLKALPGLAASIGHISMRDHHPANQLPQQFYRAAAKVANSPQLYQRLCSFRLPPTATQLPIQPGQAQGPDMPQRLRLNGPVEIFIRYLGEN